MVETDYDIDTFQTVINNIVWIGFMSLGIIATIKYYQFTQTITEPATTLIAMMSLLYFIIVWFRFCDYPKLYFKSSRRYTRR